MKKIVLLSALAIISAPAFAQFDFGVKGAATLSKLQFENLEDNASIEKIAGSDKLGWQAGFFARIKMLAIYIQPEILYSELRGDVVVNHTDGTSNTEQFRLLRLDVPVSLGFKIGAASISAGPVMSYNLNSDASEILEIEYKDGTLGYQVGIGLTLGDFIIDLEYEGSFQSIANEVVIDGNAYKVDARTGQFMLGIGYSFF